MLFAESVKEKSAEKTRHRGEERRGGVSAQENTDEALIVQAPIVPAPIVQAPTVECREAERQRGTRLRKVAPRQPWPLRAEACAAEPTPPLACILVISQIGKGESAHGKRAPNCPYTL